MKNILSSIINAIYHSYKAIAVCATIATMILFANPSIPKRLIFIISVSIIIIIFLYYLFIPMIPRKYKLKTSNSVINIYQGDILSDAIYNNDSLVKVLSFNEYFDTDIRNNQIISINSLNGRFIKEKVKSVSTLDNKIRNDISINPIKTVNNRALGKKDKYELGTIFKYSDSVFLTALSHFDQNNRAYLSTNDYIKFLLNFWNNLDKRYAGKSVALTLFGSGITRFNDKELTETQLIKIILFTFWISDFNPNSKAPINILLDKKTYKEINYFYLKEWFNALQK